MFVDASAIVAILAREADGAELMQRLAGAERVQGQRRAADVEMA